MTFTEYIWRELRRLQNKYGIIIKWVSKTDEYFVYSASGKLEFIAHGMQDLISSLHLYYD